MNRMSWLSLIRHQVVTDARRMRTELSFYYVVLALATGICLLWPGPRGSGQTPFIDILNGIAVLYPLLLTASVILRDPPGVVAAFWQGRPVTRPTLLVAKLVFIAIAIVLPPLVCTALVASSLAGAAAASISANLVGWAAWWILLAAAAAAWSGAPSRFAYTVVGLVTVLFLVTLLEEILRRSAAGPALGWIKSAGSGAIALPWLLALLLGAYLRPSRRVLSVILVCGLPLTMLLHRVLEPDTRPAGDGDIPAFSVRVKGDRLLHLADAGVFVGLSADLDVRGLPSPWFAVLGAADAKLIEHDRERTSYIDLRSNRRAYAAGAGWRSAYENEHEREPRTLEALFDGAVPCHIHEWSVRHAPLTTVFRYADLRNPITGNATLKANLDYDVFRFEQVGDGVPLTPGRSMEIPGLTVMLEGIVPDGSHVRVTVTQRKLHRDLWPVFHNAAFVLVWPERKIVCPSVGETYMTGASLGPVQWSRKTLRFGNLESVAGGQQLLEPDTLAEAELRLVNRIHVGTRTVRLEHKVSPPEATP